MCHNITIYNMTPFKWRMNPSDFHVKSPMTLSRGMSDVSRTLKCHPERFKRVLNFVFPQDQNKPAHDKTYSKTCATSEDSDQTAHPRSLIRVFADRICLLQSLDYTKKDKREMLSYWVDVQADLCSCAGSHCNSRQDTEMLLVHLSVQLTRGYIHIKCEMRRTKVELAPPKENVNFHKQRPNQVYRAPLQKHAYLNI